MKITKLEYGKKNKQRVNIYLDDAFAFAIYYDIVSENLLAKGKELSSEDIESLKKEDEKLIATRAAFDILTKRSISSGLLIERLIKKGVEKDLANTTSEYMQQKGYIDDESYAKTKAKYLQQRKKYGKSRIKITLMQDKIDKEIIEQTLLELDSQESLENLMNILKVFVKRVDLTSYPEKQKLVMKLVRKGYGYDEINMAIKEYNNEG